MLDSSYPAKVLLFGEYTILNGSKALAIPYNELSGKWSFSETTSERAAASRKSLKSFLNHHSEEYINLEALKADLDKGLWFDSSIPEGVGLGSSGALIAAIYDHYSLHKGNLTEKRVSLANLESHFHGSSSGLDPLVSLVNRPLLIHDFNNVEVLEKPLNLDGFFLLDTGKPRQTGPLVTIYQQKLKDPNFKKGCAEVLQTDVNLAIDAVLQNNKEHLFHHLWHISKFQFDFFSEMIPFEMQCIWSKGLESGEYILKLCGAGGGGFLLGYCEKLKYINRELFYRLDLRELK